MIERRPDGPQCLSDAAVGRSDPATGDDPGQRGRGAGVSPRGAERHPDLNATFAASLAGVDGSSLRLPGDLKGKIVVVHFFASSSRRSVAHLRQMKALHEEYAAKGVEIVSVSLDADRKTLDALLAREKLPWTVTFSGKGADDPTAKRYGVTARDLPELWVIGRNGRVLSDTPARTSRPS